MSSGMLSGKESLNRIKLSQLVQDLLNFAVFGSLRLWAGAGGWRGCQGHLGAWGMSPTHAHACACMHIDICTCIHV